MRLPLRPGGWAVVLLALVGALPRPAAAAPPPDDELAKADEALERDRREAERAGSTARLLATYESKYGRQPTLLNRYLYARALFTHKDKVGALRELRGVVEAEPEFWQARLRLAFLYVQEKNYPLARQHLELAERRAPDNEWVLELGAQIAVATKDWDKALATLRRLEARHPDDPMLAGAIAAACVEKQDWPCVYEKMQRMEAKARLSLQARDMLAWAAFKTGRAAEATRGFEALVLEDARNADRYLQALQQVHWTAKDWKALAGVLERRRPFLPAEARVGLDEEIAHLKAGQAPGTRPAPPPEPKLATPEELTLALFERCVSPDVETRRAALQEFHAARLEFIPRAILLRYHPQEEPDPVCRAWVVRIAGALQSDMTAKVPGHALLDPDTRVRRVAAEALGEIGAAAGLLYLLTFLAGLPLGPDASDEVVQEFNAARLALVALTEFDDLEIGATRWVPAAGLAASWGRWEAWFASPAGVAAQVRAVRDLLRTGEPNPEWYLVTRVVLGPPEVARAAHEAMVEVSAQPMADGVAKAMWPLLPRLRTQADGKDLTPEQALADLRSRVTQWWRDWRALRSAEPR